MTTKREQSLMPRSARDPFSMLRQMTSDFDRMFGEPAWPRFRFPMLRRAAATETSTWFPEVDVFEKDGRLVTKIDLPGMKKEDVKVEVADGQLNISGERRTEAEQQQEQFYRCEREYGSFYRSVPLPDGVKLEDVKAMFADGVLEVSVPLPAKPEAKSRKVEISEPSKTAKTAA